MAKSGIVLLFAVLCVASIGAQASTVYQTAQSAGLTDLVAAIDAAGLKSMLNNPNFKGTVFAPTNAAFDSLVSSLNTTIAAVLKNKALLTAVLNYHIIPDDLLTKKSLAEIQSWGTNLQNADITIYKSPQGTLRVYYGNQTAGPKSITWAGSAKVVKADIQADKAIVQVIDQVLVPPS